MAPRPWQVIPWSELAQLLRNLSLRGGRSVDYRTRRASVWRRATTRDCGPVRTALPRRIPRRPRERQAHPAQLHQRRVGRLDRGPHERPRRPEHRRGVRLRAGLGRRGRRPRLRRGLCGLRVVARHHPVGASEGAARDRRRPRGARRRARRARVAEHGQAGRGHHGGGDPADDRPDPLLRRCCAGARGPRSRRVHGGPHLDDPPRADRRHRPGHAVELPDDDGGVEVRPGDRRRQHGGAQAVATPRRSRPCAWPS